MESKRLWRLKEIAEILLLLSFAAAPWYAIHRWGPKLDTLLDNGNKTVLNINSRVSDTSSNLNAVLIQFGIAADQMAQASREQKTDLAEENKLAEAGLKKLIATVDSLHDFMQHTDVSVNRKALPALADDLKMAQPAIQHLDSASANLDAAVSHLPDIASNVQSTSAAAAQGTQSLAGAAADIKKETDKFVAPATLPKKILHGFLAGLDAGYKALRLYFLPW